MAETFSDNPMEEFERLLKLAEKNEISDPNAMSLATVDVEGRANVRIVLLKRYDERGFVFFTNLGSSKGEEFKTNKNLALCFHWKSLRKQVRVRGTATLIGHKEADEYYSTRPRLSRIGAWASSQSRPLKSKSLLIKLVAKYGAKYAVGPVPRPEYWSGIRLSPLQIEIWHDGANRLHDRFKYQRKSPDSEWQCQRLFP